MRREARGSQVGEGWSPAPVVYGKVNRKLSLKSQSILRRLLLLLSSRPQHDGSTGGSERAEERREELGVVDKGIQKVYGGGRVHCSFLPLGDRCEPSLGRGGIAHHLAAD